MIEARLEKGKRQYGEQLEVDDGREWLEEALEELLDAIVYLTAELLLIKKNKDKNEKTTLTNTNSIVGTGCFWLGCILFSIWSE